MYTVFTGPTPRRSMLWAVVLRAGDGAMLSHETAAELWGLSQGPSAVIHVTVPWGRTPTRLPGIVIHRSRSADDLRHPTRSPPLTRVEDTVVALTQTANGIEDAIAWLARAVAGRHTTARRLSDAMARRSRLRWRAELEAAVQDVAAGCHSLLELRYLRQVERAHGLPASQRQVRRQSDKGYDDVRYPRLRTRVELDGRAAHPEHARWRDMRRDNSAVVEGDQVLRYGTGDVTSDPCQVALQVSRVLRAAGWSGSPHRCRLENCAFP